MASSTIHCGHGITAEQIQHSVLRSQIYGQHPRIDVDLKMSESAHLRFVADHRSYVKRRQAPVQYHVYQRMQYPSMSITIDESIWLVCLLCCRLGPLFALCYFELLSK